MCVGDQRMGCRFGKWLHSERRRAIHFSTITISRPPAPRTYSRRMSIPASSPFFIKRGKHSATMDQRLRLCNTSLMSFAVICKAASHSCLSIRSHLRCRHVPDRFLCKMPSHLFVSAPAACNQIELSHTIYSLSTASPNNQPATLSPFTTADGPTSQKRSLIPTRWT